MSALPRVSENAAVEIETILLSLETTQGKEAANSFMNSFLRYRPLIGLNAKNRPKKTINGITYYRFIYPGWNYLIYYEMVNGAPVIELIVKQ